MLYKDLYIEDKVDIYMRRLGVRSVLMYMRIRRPTEDKLSYLTGRIIILSKDNPDIE